jgi:hypothetical protein
MEENGGYYFLQVLTITHSLLLTHLLLLAHSGVSKSVAKGIDCIIKGEDDEAINYFVDILPRIRAKYGLGNHSLTLTLSLLLSHSYSLTHSYSLQVPQVIFPSLSSRSTQVTRCSYPAGGGMQC